MRFYPFGSSSLNQTYNTALATTASLAAYAESASFGIRVVTASYALQGVRGINGLPGSCSYQPGIPGDTGSQGFGGSNGGISLAYPAGAGF
jgi:hypothetical protein